ncbi:glycosyltransferase family 61 protein [Hymenobacter sp. B1770]|uniref:glycosyltransferase family 61 protein n=1 Tax=Hymenobacter sp. B1770 TaxID=1718788 RepID=UPI003CF81A32
MNIKTSIEELRHISYRFKVRLIYNSAFGKALRKTTWKIAGPDDGVVVTYSDKHHVFDKHTTNHIQDARIIEKFAWEVNRWSLQSDVIFKLEGEITVEPKNSLAYLSNNRFFKPTRSNAHEYLVPEISKDLLHRAFSRKYTHYDALIHLDGFIGKNLYHFFDESVNALLLFQKVDNTDLRIPLLINEKVYTHSYVKYLLALPEFKDLQIVVQRADEWIKVKKLYKATPSYSLWADCYVTMARHVVKNPHRRIFLNRKPQFQRRLTNNAAIEAIVKQYGFEVIYAEDLTYAEQVAMFAETEYFIGLHGAGFTNLIFSDLSRVHVLEIFSESLVHPHYYWYLELLKVNYYDAIMGSVLDVNWNYSLDEAIFSEQMRLMMQENNTLGHHNRPIPIAGPGMEKSV